MKLIASQNFDSKRLAGFSPRPARSRGLGHIAAVCAASATLWSSAPAQAEGEFKVSGFASLVAAKTMGACQPTGMATEYQSTCTRYVADWGHGAAVTDKLEINRESRAGVQVEWKLNRELAAVGQVTARTLKNQHVNLEWAYLSYSPTPEWKLQVGRKRIPLFYYSDFQDVGFAYNTVRPPPDVYGWDVVNYNGASLSTTRTIGDWNLRAEVYGGWENSRKNPFNTLISSTDIDVRWGGLAGTSVEFSKDWFTARFSYTRSNVEMRDHATGELLELFDGQTRTNQDFIGLGLNGDWDDWQWRSEFGKAHRLGGSGYTAVFYLMTLSRQFGQFTVTGGISNYGENTIYTPDVYVPLKTFARSIGVRYDLHKGGALKLQFDKISDNSAVTYVGNARVLTLAYDLVF